MNTGTAEIAQRGSGRYERVVACAAELFLERGIQDVKMVDIADASHVGVATLYRHFSTKAAIAVSAATYMWREFNQEITCIVESDAFLALDGLGRLEALLRAYCDAYASHRAFVAFLDEFDHMVVSGRAAVGGLEEYGGQLDSFYVVFEDAYLMGLADGSVRREVDFRTFYLSLAHALMGVAQKLQRGEIIPSDDFSHAEVELQTIVDMALWSLGSDAAFDVRRRAAKMGG